MINWRPVGHILGFMVGYGSCACYILTTSHSRYPCWCVESKKTWVVWNLAQHNRWSGNSEYRYFGDPNRKVRVGTSWIEHSGARIARLQLFGATFCCFFFLLRRVASSIPHGCLYSFISTLNVHYQDLFPHLMFIIKIVWSTEVRRVVADGVYVGVIMWDDESLCGK